MLSLKAGERRDCVSLKVCALAVFPVFVAIFILFLAAMFVFGRTVGMNNILIGHFPPMLIYYIFRGVPRFSGTLVLEPCDTRV